MHSLFYDDLEYGPSLLKSPKLSAKRDHYTTLNGKLQGSGRCALDEQHTVVTRNGPGVDFEMKSILKNNHINYNDNYCTPTTVQYRYNQLAHQTSYLNHIIRPCAAEFVAVFLTIFVGKLIENELLLHVLTSSNERITLQALTDAVLVLIVVMAFQTVHLSPVITLAELFALTTAWPMCCAMLVIQILASVSAIILFAMLRFGGVEMRMPAILQDVTVDRTAAAYHLVLSQFTGTLLVVISHLLLTTKRGTGLTALAWPAASPMPIAAAVFISSLLCLLNSTIGWNPLLAFALASYDSIGCDLGPLQRHGIFWIGPCLGSLLACFLYRLLFSAPEYRLLKCDAAGSTTND